MSREERKMAQIIASIERMEQDAGAAQEQHGGGDTARQGRGKKNKKGKASGVKVKAGRKLRVSAVASGGKEPFERKLTPKKRWIQLWSAQLDTIKEKDESSSPEDPEAAHTATNADVQVEAPKQTEAVSAPAVATSPVAEVKVALAASPAAVEKPMETPKSPEKPVDVPAPAPTAKKAEKTLPIPVPVIVEDKPQVEQVSETPKVVAATTPKAISGAASAASTELRVKTPQNTESSHLSPPLDRNSPTTTASISPSAKVKDSETPNTSTAAVAAAATAAKFSPSKSAQDIPVATEKNEHFNKETIPPRLERKSSSSSSKAEECIRMEAPDHHHERSKKRSLEPSEPMSEEAKRRAERRRKRKSNWDVGDPRKGGSPVVLPDKTPAAAAANQQSFAKYPPNRPSWRHSQSMLDMKPQFQSGHRSSFYNNGPTSGRRGFYHSNSMPLDRSRSAGRSSTRYSYGTNSTNSNYR